MSHTEKSKQNTQNYIKSIQKKLTITQIHLVANASFVSTNA